MKKLLLPFLCLFIFTLQVVAQHRVTFRVIALPADHSINEDIIMAGSFNGWNPAHAAFRMQKNGQDQYSLTTTLNPGTYEFKLTRGGWDKGETGADGAAIPNRLLKLSSDTVINLSVQAWADQFEQPEARSTANAQVKIIDTAFFIPQLNRYRRIWIYLPPSYANSKKEYPVMYMHDGQNLFDEATSYSGEWGIDEAMDTLGPAIKEMIVVGIDNGGDKRLNEYSPYDMERFGKGEGAAYADFLVSTLKPFIDNQYRTCKKRKNTFVAGSSMGGLISLYTVLRHPKTFGGAGIFSPAFWVAPAIEKAVMDRGKKVKARLYFHAGMLEGDDMVPDMLRIFEAMNKVSRSKMISVIRAEGRHHESAWRQEFPIFYEWLMDK